MSTNFPHRTFVDLIESLSLPEPRVYHYAFATPEAPRTHGHLPVTGTRHVEAYDMSLKALLRCCQQGEYLPCDTKRERNWFVKCEASLHSVT